MTSIKLTPREHEVLRELATGATDREIARKLGLSVGTIRTHVKSIRQSLNVSNRTEAIVVAMQLGLLDTPESAAEQDALPSDMSSDLSATPADEIRSRKRRIVRWLPILMIVGILALPGYRMLPYVWAFYFGPTLIHDYDLAYAATDNILTHDNGWCSAWPVAVEDAPYGYKLYFAKDVVVENFEVSPHYMYYRGRWVGPLTVRLQSYDSESDRWIFETSRWFKDLFPRSQDFLSWRYDYLCPTDS